MDETILVEELYYIQAPAAPADERTRWNTKRNDRKAESKRPVFCFLFTATILTGSSVPKSCWNRLALMTSPWLVRRALILQRATSRYHERVGPVVAGWSNLEASSAKLVGAEK
jgi:hypothetical protein